MPTFYRPLLDVLAALYGDALIRLLVGVALLFALTNPGAVSRYPQLVDWQTIAALAGLLILTKSVEMSGALDVLARRLVAGVGSLRQLGLVLVAAAAVLSMLVTNDVALFAVVPLTLKLGAEVDIPLARLVTLEALAVNAGSCLTPMGNPQNLFVWQHFKMPFWAFVGALLPVSILCMATLLVVTWCSFDGRRLEASSRTSLPAPHAIDRRLLVIAAALYLPFLVLDECHLALPALAGVALVLALVDRRVLMRVDWPLVVVIVLMFIDLRMLAGLSQVHAWLGAADLAAPRHLYAAALAASQVISNVPAAIVLTQYSDNSAIIAAGVSVGGFGLVVGSLANLIALRLLHQHRSWIVFHAYSVPLLVVNGVLVYSWLFLR